MASEQKIRQVLDLLTIAPAAQAESLRAVQNSAAREHSKSLRDQILLQDNIVGVGISEKVSKGKKVKKLALTFYVEKKIPLHDLRASEAIPATVPESISGPSAIPTDVVVVGKIRPQGNPFITRHPVQPGFSIGHKNITAGTLGAVVMKGKEIFLLSNSHVFADSGLGKKGDAILYPGPADGGIDPTDIVAILEKFHPFVNTVQFVNEVDCAIARPTAAGLAKINRQIKDLGFPKGTIKAKRGMKIVKVGRTTRKTVGEIKDVNFRTQITYDGVGKIGFMEQIFCTRYSEGGDSGALVLDKATGKAVGLHFAGSEEGSMCNPIDTVLKHMGVQLVLKDDVAVVKKVIAKKIAVKKKAVKKKAAKKS
jgi:hypothetical protein